jgi:hypothetical protein
MTDARAARLYRVYRRGSAAGGGVDDGGLDDLLHPDANEFISSRKSYAIRQPSLRLLLRRLNQIRETQTRILRVLEMVPPTKKGRRQGPSQN